MVITCSRTGMIAAWRRPGLAVVLWVWNLLCAAVIAFPAWRWWYNSTAWSPETDALLRRFSLGVMAELLRDDSSPGLLITASLALAVLAFIGQALVAGGTIEVLTSNDARPLLHRFFRGAGHFFGRFLRAAIVGAVTFLVGVIAVLAVSGPIGRVLEEVDWEPAWYLGQVTSLLIMALVVLLVIQALDYARIRMVRVDSHRALRAFAGGLVFVVRHPRATFGVWSTVAVLTAAVLGVYVGFCEIVPAVGWVTIMLTLALQQVTMLVRAGLRVALVEAEIAVWERFKPVVSGFEPRLSISTGASEQPPVAGSTVQVAGSSSVTIDAASE